MNAVSIFPAVNTMHALQDTTRIGSAQDFTRITDIDSFWTMAQQGGGIGYVIMGVLAIGLFFILLKWIELVIDKTQSRRLLKANFSPMSFVEIEGLAAQNGKSIFGELVNHLVSFYKATGTAYGLQQEVAAFLEQQAEIFESFRGRLHFLSDSAGALGLLGTVWGVFLTFFGGDMDSEKILSGMAVALITTLLGLVVSLILTFGSTEISSFFNRRMKAISKKADELRLRLLAFDAQHGAPTVAGVETEATRTESAAAPERTLSLVCPQAQHDLPAGEYVEGALRLQTVDALQKPVAGIRVLLKTEGAVSLRDKLRAGAVVMNKKGVAAIGLQCAQVPGHGKIHCQIEGAEHTLLTKEFVVGPNVPDKILIHAGNDQAGEVGLPLAEPMQVLLRDRFNNPVPGVPVIFKIAMGEGVFDGGNHQLETATDAQGLAAARFQLGKQTGFHTIRVLAKNARVEPVEFRILAKS